jgi:2-hydroxy-6-oxonona-2,4-dienedioate hydrolase
LKNLIMVGHSKEFVATLPDELANAYFHFQHLPHYLISTISLIRNMITEIKAEELAGLQQMTALILGTNDNFLSSEKGRQIVEAMPNGSFFPILDSGHLPWLEDPKRVSKIILDFFNK